MEGTFRLFEVARFSPALIIMIHKDVNDMVEGGGKAEIEARNRYQKDATERQQTTVAWRRCERPRACWAVFTSVLFL
jgi:hypothetical protein